MNNKNTTTVYTPGCRTKIGFFKAWASMFKNIITSRDLIVQLFKRDFFAVYKKSFLGICWIVIAPLIGIISWVFMNATGVLNPGDVGIPYPAYVLLGTSIWGLFMGFYTASAATLDVGAAFILQVKYPHEVLLVKQMAQQLANFLISFSMTIAVLIMFGVMPSWKILFFPVLILPLFFLGAAIGLVISVMNVISKEFQKFTDIVLGFCLYLTPVIYSPHFKNQILQEIIQWNPLTYLIGGVRDVIVYGRMDHWDRFAYAGFFSFAAFLLSWRLFYVSEDKMIEKMI